MYKSKSYCLTYDQRLAMEGCPLKKHMNTEIFLCGKGEIFPREWYSYIDTFPEEATRPQAFNYARAFKSVIQKCKDDDVQSLLYFEDDAYPIEGFQESVATVLKQAQEFPWEALYLGGIHVNGTYEVLGSHLIKPSYSLDMHAIIIKSTLFDEILSFGECYTHTLDGHFSSLQKKHLMLAANPSIFVQRPCFSYNSFKVENKLKYYGDIREFSWEKANATN